MLKFENVIRNLNLEEKVTLITSDRLGNNAVSHYNVPTFSLVEDIKENANNIILPNYSDLGQTWNLELVNKFAEGISFNSIYNKQKNVIGVPTFTSGNLSFGSCQYLVGKLAAAYIRGIENGGSFSCLDKAPSNYDNSFLGSEIAYKEGSPSAVLSNGSACSKLLNDTYYKGLKISNVTNKEELISSIYEGNNLFFTENIDAYKTVVEAVVAYKNAKEEFLNGKITLADFNTLEKTGKILDEERLDASLDGLLFNLMQYAEKLSEEGEVFDNSLLKEVAEESIVLLENNNILPLNNSIKVALIGELLVKPIMNNKGEVSQKVSPIARFNRYELNLVGHAYGYNTEVKNQEKLLDEAIVLSSNADVSVVYIGTETGNSLPENQLKLIEELHENNVKLVGVLSGKLDIDLSFADMFDALIYTGFNTVESIDATVKAILGLVNPSGRLTNRYLYSNGSYAVKYPLGHGLSYSNFQYQQFKLLHNGISMSVENLDNFSGSDVVSLYVSRIENGVENEKELKGFVKTSLKAQEYQKVTLLFDEYTFKEYKNDKLGVIGGVYALYVCRNENEVLYKTEISLETSFENENAYDYEMVEKSSNDELVKDFINSTGSYKNKSRLSLKSKLMIETVIYVYFLSALLIVGLNVEGLLIVALAALGILTLIFGLVIRNTVVKEKEYEKLASPHPINDMVNDLDSFIVSSKAEFKPVLIKEEEKEVKKEEPTVVVEENVAETEEVIAEEIEEAIEVSFATCEFELKDDTLEYSNDVEFGLLCSNFYEFALKKGLIIEQSSIRMIISSICSTKLLFLRSTRMDLLPKVISVLNEFLGNDENIFDVNALEDNSLIWKTVDDAKVHTEFVKTLYQAKKYRKHLNIITLNNVKLESMDEYFNEYFKYCTNPAVNYNVNFGTKSRKEIFSLPNNLMFVVIPESYDFIEDIPFNVAVNSTTLEIQVRENELISDSEVAVKHYPYYSYMATIEMEKNNFYLPEESWKRIDDFEETLALTGKFRVENKTVLQIESFVTALIACGADEAEVFDAAVATKIAPTVKSYKLYKPGKESATVQAALERHFEMDLIPLTQRVLRKKD